MIKIYKKQKNQGLCYSYAIDISAVLVCMSVGVKVLLLSQKDPLCFNMKRTAILAKCIKKEKIFLLEEVGFEPTTPPLLMTCSTTELHPHLVL